MPGLSHWQHPSFFGYFPSNGELSSRARRLPEHGPRRARPVLAVEPGADRARGGDARLGAPDGRPVGRLERRHPGHRLHQHAGRAALRARAGDALSASPAAACRARRSRSSSTPRATATARSRRRRCSPASAARTCGSVPIDEKYAMRAGRARRGHPRGPRARPAALRGRRHDRHHHLHARSTRSSRSPALAPTHGLWLHVDAAMAGSAMILPECRPMWEGIEGADSLVLNAHKWLGAAFDCSLYYVRDPEHLVRVMSTNPSYLQSVVDGQVKNLRDWGIPLGRRFRALKLWCLHPRAGRRGAAGAPAPRPRERALARARRPRATPGWRVLAPVPLQTVCLRHEPAGLEGEALDRHTLALGRARQPLGRRLRDPRHPRRPLDGARLDRRAADRARARRGPVGAAASRGGGSSCGDDGAGRGRRVVRAIDGSGVTRPSHDPLISGGPRDVRPLGMPTPGDARDLLRARQPDERARDERVHRGLARDRAVAAAPPRDPRRVGPLVPAGHARDGGDAPAHHPRLRRLPARALRGALRGAGRSRPSRTAWRRCSRRRRCGPTRSGGSTTGPGRCSCHVFPDADVPVVQLSIDETQPAAFHHDLGRRLGALRDEGVLVIGSGNLVHNLHAYGWGRPAMEPFDWALRFETEARGADRARRGRPARRLRGPGTRRAPLGADAGALPAAPVRAGPATSRGRGDVPRRGMGRRLRLHADGADRMSGLLSFSGFELDLERQELRRAGRRIALPAAAVPRARAARHPRGRGGHARGAPLGALAGRHARRLRARDQLLPEPGAHRAARPGPRFALRGDAAADRLPVRGGRAARRAGGGRLRPSPSRVAAPVPRRPWWAFAAVLALAGTTSGVARPTSPAPPHDAAAQADYVRGLALLQQSDLGAWERAADALTAAVAREPTHADAQAALARVLLGLADTGRLPSADAMTRARRAALAALREDPRLADAWVSLALVRLRFDWDWSAAGDLDRAIALSPDLARAHRAQAMLLSARGAHGPAIRAATRAAALDPVCPTLRGDLGWYYYCARRFPEAAEQWRLSRRGPGGRRPAGPAGRRVPPAAPARRRLARSRGRPARRRHGTRRRSRRSAGAGPRPPSASSWRAAPPICRAGERRSSAWPRCTRGRATTRGRRPFSSARPTSARPGCWRRSPSTRTSTGSAGGRRTSELLRAAGLGPARGSGAGAAHGASPGVLNRTNDVA